MQLSESPTFKRMKEEGKSSKAPLRDSFTNWKNGRLVLIALFGLVAGQAVTWYTAQFYALFFLTQTLKVDAITANILVAIAILLATPLFVFFGWLSDKIGRKPIIMTGLLGAALCYFPVYNGLTAAANPALLAAQTISPIVVVADPNECSFQFNPVGTAKFKSSCDIAKSHLAKAGLNYQNQTAPAGTIATVMIGDKTIQSYDGAAVDAKDKA